MLYTGPPRLAVSLERGVRVAYSQGCIQDVFWGELSKTVIDFEEILDVFKEKNRIILLIYRGLCG